MIAPDITITKKVKDDQTAVYQANRIADMLEEASFCYDLGIAEPFFIEIRRFLNESIGFYDRHRRPDSNMQGMAKRQLKLANKMAATTLVNGLNKLLSMSGGKTISFPTSIRELERACGKLFHYVGEPRNVVQSTGGGGNKDGKEDTDLIPLA